MQQIYLDYNATTPVAPSVQEAMLPFFAEHYGNPSSHHALGRACHEAINDARSQVAALLGANSDEIVFTSCATESSNLAIKGTAFQLARGGTGHVVISALEHPATLEPARFLERLGYSLTLVGCDQHGVVDPDAVEAALRPDTVLVSIMHANNEIGTIQPIREIAAHCQNNGVLLHCDAAQTVGKIRVNVDELKVDLLSIAGHKFYAPKGVGALYVRRGVILEPLIHGASHERGLRAGTENVAYAVALGKAASLAAKGNDDAADRMAMLRDRLHRQLAEVVGEKLVVHGAQAARIPNTLSLSFPGVSGHDMLARATEVCASTGSACHSGEAIGSGTLAALGVSPEIARGTIRLSVGWYTSEEQVDRAASLLLDAWESLRQ